MKIGRLEIRWSPLPAVTLAQPRMSEEEISAALAVEDKNPLWRAVLQLQGETEEGARINIGAEHHDPHLTTWNAGGAEYLAVFRKRLLERREQALQAFRRDPRKLAQVKIGTGMRDGAGRRPGEED